MENTQTTRQEKPLWQQMLLFATPIFLSYLFQNLYNSVDSLIVGNLVSKEALAAVSNCSTATNIMTGFFTGLSSGALAIFSRYFGAGKYDEFDRSINTAVLFAVIFGLMMAVSGYLMAEKLLQWMGFRSDIIVYGVPYLKIYFLGSVFTAVFNICSGISRSIGDSRSPFYILILTTVVNLALDLLFVAVLKLSVVGVACSTVISQLVSAVSLFALLTRKNDYYHLSISTLKIHKDKLVEMIQQGLPAGLQTALVSFSNSLMQRYVNSFDTDIITGIGVAKKVDNFAMMPSQSVGITTATFVSQAYGAGNKKLIKRILKTGVVIMAITSAFIVIPITVFSDGFVALFNRNPGVIAEGSAMIHVIAPLFFLHGAMDIGNALNRGFKRSFQVMVFSLLSMIVIRQLFLWIAFSIEKNIFFIHVCYPMCWGICALFNIVYFIIINKKEKLLD
ncbi:MAG: MATE family efflux transporter [Erysipelotrichaceae bacterium]|nr:MATE family efflux transporter [Erysipelotrichaceae bacterium]